MKLEIGRLYKVILSDCCIEGGFESKLIKGGEHEDLEFENGVVLSTHYGCTFEEIETEDNSIF